MTDRNRSFRRRTQETAQPTNDPASFEVEEPWDPDSFGFDDPALRLAIAKKQWAGTESAKVVKTAAYLEGIRAVTHIAQRCQLGCFYGPVGTSKTLTALSACQRLSIRPLYVGSAPSRSGKDVEFQILQEIDPENAKPGLLRYIMRRLIVDRLAQEPCLLVLDEFELSKGEGADVLRFLLEQRRSQAGILVVGTNADKILRASPPLESRCARWVPFDATPAGDRIAVARAYHPIFAATSDKVLQRMDTEWAHGNFRDLAKFLEAALRLPADETARGLTEAHLKLIYGLINRPSDKPGKAA